jgi:hypothetical protein
MEEPLEKSGSFQSSLLKRIIRGLLKMTAVILAASFLALCALDYTAKAGKESRKMTADACAIALSMVAYKKTHDGQLPPSLSDLDFIEPLQAFHPNEPGPSLHRFHLCPPGTMIGKPSVEVFAIGSAYYGDQIPIIYVDGSVGYALTNNVPIKFEFKK